MKTTKQTQELYQQGNDYLALINKTMREAGEESTSFIVCQTVKECMYYLLHCYLLLKNGTRSSSGNLSELITQCAVLDERFGQIDVRMINCRDLNFETADDQFCMSPHHIQNCTSITNMIKKILDEEMNKVDSALT
jgi:hypothetical protein